MKRFVTIVTIAPSTVKLLQGTSQFLLKTGFGRTSKILEGGRPYSMLFGGIMPNRFLGEKLIPRSAALWFYRQATHMNRRDLWNSFVSAGQFPVAVLFYHRVANHSLTDWSITRDGFLRHLDWLMDHFDVLPLSRCQELIRSTTNSRPAVAITFDDGYAENMDFALPELKRRGLPCTYFVATDFVKKQTPFPHDEELGYTNLQPHTISQIREVASMGFEIGAHTRGHVDIASLKSREQIEHQIIGSAEVLRFWSGQPVKYFSFPYGLPRHMSQLAVDVISSAGFDGFCSAYGALNWPGSNGFHLRRIHADPGMESLKNWLTLDPRKLKDKAVLPFIEPTLVNGLPSQSELSSNLPTMFAPDCSSPTP